MKTIKSFFLFFVLALLINSCVIKSLYAFYTIDLLIFEQRIVGHWLDTNNGSWEILPYQEAFLKESSKQDTSEMDEEELELFNKYKKGYIMYYEKDSTKTSFLAMSFKIDNQLFLDIIPIDDEESEDES